MDATRIRDLEAYMRGREQTFVDRLAELVAIDSGTGSIAGVNRVVDRCAEWLEAEGASVRRPPLEGFGDLAVADVDGRGGPGAVMLIGHTDTVFADGTAAERPFRVDGDHLLGPGVCDMKGGLVIGMLAIEALRATGTPFGRVTFVLDPDEEVGSPSSREFVSVRAKEADAVLVLEAARENGAVVTARKGVTNARMEFRGRAAHAGVEPEKGRSAVLEAAHKTIALHALNGRWDGTTVNVGVSAGGTRVNVVPEHAALTVELRSMTEAALSAAEEELRRLAVEAVVEGVTVSLEISREHGPMERSPGTAALFEAARTLALQLGMTIEESATGGASDANITAAMGIPTLDGLGPVGGDDHSPAEWIQLSSVVPRTAMLAGLIGWVSAGSAGDAIRVR